MDAGIDFDDAVLGLGLPAAAEQALRDAGALRSPPAAARLTAGAVLAA